MTTSLPPAFTDVRHISPRVARLRERCALERRQLTEQVAAIEARLQGADSALNAVQSFIRKPAVLAAGAGALLLMRRTRGAMSLLSRGMVLFAAGRRIYRLLKH